MSLQQENCAFVLTMCFQSAVSFIDVQEFSVNRINSFELLFNQLDYAINQYAINQSVFLANDWFWFGIPDPYAIKQIMQLPKCKYQDLSVSLVFKKMLCIRQLKLTALEKSFGMAHTIF